MQAQRIKFFYLKLFLFFIFHQNGTAEIYSYEHIKASALEHVHLVFPQGFQTETPIKSGNAALISMAIKSGMEKIDDPNWTEYLSRNFAKIHTSIEAKSTIFYVSAPNGYAFPVLEALLYRLRKQKLTESAIYSYRDKLRSDFSTWISLSENQTNLLAQIKGNRPSSLRDFYLSEPNGKNIIYEDLNLKIIGDYFNEKWKNTNVQIGISSQSSIDDWSEKITKLGLNPNKKEYVYLEKKQMNQETTSFKEGTLRASFSQCKRPFRVNNGSAKNGISNVLIEFSYSPANTSNQTLFQLAIGVLGGPSYYSKLNSSPYSHQYWPAGGSARGIFSENEARLILQFSTFTKSEQLAISEALNITENWKKNGITKFEFVSQKNSLKTIMRNGLRSASNRLNWATQELMLGLEQGETIKKLDSIFRTKEPSEINALLKKISMCPTQIVVSRE